MKRVLVLVFGALLALPCFAVAQDDTEYDIGVAIGYVYDIDAVPTDEYSRHNIGVQVDFKAWYMDYLGMQARIAFWNVFKEADFWNIPLTFGVNYRLPKVEDMVTPYFGAGMGYYLWWPFHEDGGAREFGVYLMAGMRYDMFFIEVAYHKMFEVSRSIAEVYAGVRF